MNERPPNWIRRMALIWSGALDALIGAAILLGGFGVLPVDVTAYGLPRWLVILIGAFMAIMGVSVAIYNFSRLDE